VFLVTTADRRNWKEDEKILFLGEWCKIYDQRHVWSKLDYQVLPYHWDDRARLHQDYLHLRNVYERYLGQLAERLNEIHRVDHSVRYWRIIVGPWLFFFIQSLYDRYLSICNAAQSRLVTNTWIATPPPGSWTPKEFSQFVRWFIGDEYNHYIYSYLIEALGEIPFEVQEQRPTFPSEDSNRTNGSALKRGLRRFLESYGRRIPSRWHKVVFVDSGLSLRDLLKLQFSLGQWPDPSIAQVIPKDIPVNETLRKSVALGPGESRFELVLDGLVPEQIPRVYLEGYAEMQQAAAAAFPKQASLIFTPLAHAGFEAFKFWAADQVERGAKLALANHGGNYGSGLWMTYEEHEIEISDRYYTWGWGIDGDSKTVPLSARKFASSQEKLKPRPDGTILWVAMSLPRYSYWMYSLPVGPQMLNYLDDQQRFARSVSPAVHDLLKLRLYMHDYGWNELSRWNDIDPTLTCYQGPTPMEEQLNESRLMIATYNATTQLETFVSNFPTVMFWNPRHWELRPAAQPYFDELRDAGILHDTPESAAALVNEIYQDPQSWWLAPKVQRARDRYCERFIRTNKDWLHEWKAELLSQISDT
jgi:putative transferase (TIGR04331 family)